MPNKKKRGFRHVSKLIATNFGYRNPRLSESYMDSEGQMLAAINTVQNDGLSGNQAADLQGVYIYPARLLR